MRSLRCGVGSGRECDEKVMTEENNDAMHTGPLLRDVIYYIRAMR